MRSNYLEFKPLSKLFYIADTAIRLHRTSESPVIELSPKDYQLLGCIYPRSDAPVVGFLLDRAYDGYQADLSDVLPLAITGAEIHFLTREDRDEQLRYCDGLLLPDSTFALPDFYFADSRAESVEHQSNQSAAYAYCLGYALKHNMPTLCIGNGALMAAGMLGLKMYRSYDYLETPIKHKTYQDKAHRLNVFPDTLLARILGNENQFHVNSKHDKLLAPLRIQQKILAEAQQLTPDKVVLPLEIYAEANDGVPEAWGLENEHLLCVQWQIGEMASKGNKQMQSIYQWLIDEIIELRRISAA